MSQTHIPDRRAVRSAGAITATLPEGDLQLEGTDVPLPPQASAMLREILAALAAGEPVTVLTTMSELTPNEAAEALNVSRATVTKLIDAGDLPCRMVGSHRRIPGAALMAYRMRQQAASAAAMDELTRLSQSLDGYGRTETARPGKAVFRGGRGA